MNRDPIVEEVHQTRQKLLEECGGELDKRRLRDPYWAGRERNI